MDKQLDFAPCGYVVMDKELTIIEMNATMKGRLGDRVGANQFPDLLTVASRIYFQTYFIPAIHIHGKVTEMYLTLKGQDGQVPVLVSAKEQDGHYECVLMEMSIRDEYENELLVAKRNAEQIQKETEKAYATLMGLMDEVEQKQAELVELNSRLLTLATTDPLTGLHNRRKFQEKLAESIAGEPIHHTGFGLIMLDIDHFKMVNDTFGHQVGDDVLKELAEKLRTALPADAVISRIGGEEFSILLTEKDMYSASEQIRHYIETSDWSSRPVTISVGATLYKEGDTPDDMYNRADSALYASKRGGRNRVTVK